VVQLPAGRHRRRGRSQLSLVLVFRSRVWAATLAEAGLHRGTVRVVIAEDLFLLREGLVRLLTAHGFDIVAAVASAPELLRALLDERPDAIAQRLFITEKAVSKHATGIFGQLDLAPSDDDNRRVLAVLAYLDS
jgi:DNA-binding NarL/FixJ family response regulator